MKHRISGYFARVASGILDETKFGVRLRPCLARMTWDLYGTPWPRRYNSPKIAILSSRDRKRKNWALHRTMDYAAKCFRPWRRWRNRSPQLRRRTTPAATIPLVCALAGNGTWLAYILATIAVLLVAMCVGRFARYSSSPGSLYTYASMILPPWLGAIAAWSLLLAYLATGSSVIGGFYHYASLTMRHRILLRFAAVILAMLVAGISMWVAWRDVKVSARLCCGSKQSLCW